MDWPVADEKITLEAEEIQELSELVFEAIARGDSRESVLADLSQNGISDEVAEELVVMAELKIFEIETVSANPANEDDGGMSWLIWVGLIVGYKILSLLFN